MISRSKVTRTKEHTTTHWSANAGITSKTAFIVYVTPYHHSRVKSNKAREVSGNNTDERQNNAASLSNPGKTLVVWRQLYKASRAQILDKATEYIQYMRRKNHTHQQDIDDLKRQNTLLEQQVMSIHQPVETNLLYIPSRPGSSTGIELNSRARGAEGACGCNQ
uniref:protein max isoform X3 n=1 Tax=Pristiophorus japonicus TaxID=55135 RepID=UPI00398EDCED